MNKYFYLTGVVGVIFISFIFPTRIAAATNFIKPTSRVYFIQSRYEDLRLFFTFNNQQKLNYLQELSDLRIKEIQNSGEDVAAINRLTNRYTNHVKQMSQVALRSQNKNEIVGRIKIINLSQQESLANIYQNISNDNAKSAITNSENISSLAIETAIENVQGETAAQEYMDQVTSIQQQQQLPMVDKAQPIPLESSSQGSPDESTPRELKGQNPIQQGQELRQLNPGYETGEGGGKLLQQQPAQMVEPAGQN